MVAGCMAPWDLSTWDGRALCHVMGVAGEALQPWWGCVGGRQQGYACPSGGAGLGQPTGAAPEAVTTPFPHKGADQRSGGWPPLSSWFRAPLSCENWARWPLTPRACDCRAARRC